MNHKKITFEKPKALSDDIIECLVDAWKPAVDILFSDTQSRSIVRALSEVERSEFSVQNIRVLSTEGGVVGAALFLDFEAIEAARQVNVLNILSQLEAEDNMVFMKSLQEYSKSFPPILKEPGIYLSKFSTVRRFRMQGLSSILMDCFLKHNKDRKLPTFLDVHEDNIAAIGLYEKYDFKFTEAQFDTPYKLMKRMP